jgi:Tol biopolymer transport system component
MKPTFAAVAFASLTSLAVAEAHAQSAGPSIAYVKVAGTAQEIYLVNPDGTGSRKIYTTPQKRAVGWLDLKPDGSEIAFTEVGKGVPRVIKIMPLSGGVPAGPARTLSGPCAVDTVDYHPTDPVLIISDICNANARIASIRTDGTGYTVLQTGGFISKARWLRDGVSYVYAQSGLNSGPIEICRNDCNPANGELLGTVQGVWGLDVGRTSNMILHDYGGPYITKRNADTGEVVASNYINGTDGHYSPDDRYVLFETPHEARGDYIQIYDSVTGLTTRLTAKGDYGAKDWRP